MYLLETLAELFCSDKCGDPFLFDSFDNQWQHIFFTLNVYFDQYQRSFLNDWIKKGTRSLKGTFCEIRSFKVSLAPKGSFLAPKTNLIIINKKEGLLCVSENLENLENLECVMCNACPPLGRRVEASVKLEVKNEIVRKRGSNQWLQATTFGVNDSKTFPMIEKIFRPMIKKKFRPMTFRANSLVPFLGTLTLHNNIHNFWTLIFCMKLGDHRC